MSLTCQKLPFGEALTRKDVPFVQLFHEAWDQHSNLVNAHTKNCRDTDQPVAALLQDLKDRDMLKDTLVIWGGEFGRTPTTQNRRRKWSRSSQPSIYYLDGRGRRKSRIHIWGYRRTRFQHS